MTMISGCNRRCIAVVANAVIALSFAKNGSLAFQPPRTVIQPRSMHLQPLTVMASSSSSSPREQLMEKLPSQSVVKAVEKLNGSGIIASDVAATAGISLSKAKQELTTLAAVSQADLAVSNDGEILYKFPKNLNGVLTQNSAKYKTIQTFRKLWPGIFWGLRVSFGVALFASLVAIFSTIMFIQTSASTSDDDRRRDDRGFGGGGGGFGRGMSWYWGPSPFDFFYYRPYGTYGYYGANTRSDPDEMGLLESIFSYVFGDGNPNTGLEERRLKIVSDMIRQNEGAVTAEQLAPFVDDAPSPDTSSDYVDESYVLPIVSSLGGEPIVTEDGEIVYVFPELLQTSALPAYSSSRPSLTTARDAMILRKAGLKPTAKPGDIIRLLNYNGISTGGVVEKRELMAMLEEALPATSEAEEAELMSSDPTVLQEREYKFSLAPGFNKFLAGGLGAVNLGGALYLGNLLGQYAAYGVRLPAYFGTVQALYPLLLGYAVLYNAVPFVRNLWIGAENEKIRQRNKRRRFWQNALDKARDGNTRLAAKLKAASRFRRKGKKLSTADSNIVYDTSKSMEVNEEKRQKQDLDDFDKLLEADDAPFQ